MHSASTIATIRTQSFALRRTSVSAAISTATCATGIAAITAVAAVARRPVALATVRTRPMPRSVCEIARNGMTSRFVASDTHSAKMRLSQTASFP